MLLEAGLEAAMIVNDVWSRDGIAVLWLVGHFFAAG